MKCLDWGHFIKNAVYLITEELDSFIDISSLVKIPPACISNFTQELWLIKVFITPFLNIPCAAFQKFGESYFHDHLVIWTIKSRIYLWHLPWSVGPKMVQSSVCLANPALPGSTHHTLLDTMWDNWSASAWWYVMVKSAMKKLPETTGDSRTTFYLFAQTTTWAEVELGCANSWISDQKLVSA